MARSGSECGKVRALSADYQLLQPGAAEWLPVARRVLNGDYDDADSSTLESVTIGLRSINNPLCAEAVKKLWPDGLPNKLKP